MDRRQLLTAGIVGLTLSVFPKNIFPQKTKNILKPKVLNVGDTVGIIAPSTAVPDPGDIQKALLVLDYFGLKPKIAGNLLKGAGYKSRSVSERIDDLHGMFLNKEVKAIFSIRGGYGSAQLLDKIDYDLIKNNPKIFIGYSDITALHLAINKFSGLITFHGPVLLSAFPNYTVDYLRKAIFSEEPIGEISNPSSLSGIRPAYPYRTITPGIAAGKLTGGNLSLISSLMGTAFEIETEGKIVFLEDVGEEPFRIDRMLTQLILAKKFDNAAGIVFGKCTDCVQNSQVWDYSLGEVLDQQLSQLHIPVLYGLLIGHTPEQVTLPYGIDATLNSVLGTLTITEKSFE
ncbi:MAG: LD-carboxypeptidase [bacterium]